MRCSYCGRPCYLGAEHPCCAIERGWGRGDCEACRIAESNRRRWEGRKPDSPVYFTSDPDQETAS